MESKIHKTSDFTFVIAKPIVHDDCTVLPAGSKLTVKADEASKDIFVGHCNNKSYTLCNDHGQFVVAN